MLKSFRCFVILLLVIEITATAAASTPESDQEICCQSLNMAFPSVKNDVFRVSLTPIKNNSDSVVVWVESKTSKSQWQLEVKDFNQHGPVGFPATVIVGLLKVSLVLSIYVETSDLILVKSQNALKLREKGTIAAKEKSELPTKESDPVIDGEIIDDNLKLTLTASVSGIWSPKYEFVLLPIQLDAFEVLSSQYKDAVEEIKALRETHAHFSSAILSLSSNSTFQGTGLVTWDGNQPRIAPSSHYMISQDGKSITFVNHGVYQISCRLAASFDACDSRHSTCEKQEQVIHIRVNGKNIASTVQRGVVNAGGGKTTAQMTEVVEIEAESVLTIEASGLASTELENRLSIVLVRAL